jgi:hypothetical protein
MTNQVNDYFLYSNPSNPAGIFAKARQGIGNRIHLLTGVWAKQFQGLMPEIEKIFKRKTFSKKRE